MRSHQEFLRAALLFSSSNTASFAKRPRDSCGFLLPCKSGFRWDFGFLFFFGYLWLVSWVFENEEESNDAVGFDWRFSVSFDCRMSAVFFSFIYKYQKLCDLSFKLSSGGLRNFVFLLRTLRNSNLIEIWKQNVLPLSLKVLWTANSAIYCLLMLM